MSTASDLADRDTVAKAVEQQRKSSRREIWVLVVINLLTGFSWLLGSPYRTRGETWNPAKELLDFLPVYPMRAWGAVFVVLSLVLFWAFLTQNVSALRWTLRVLALYWSFWCGCTVFSFGAGFISFISLGLTLQGARRHYVLAQIHPWIVKTR